MRDNLDATSFWDVRQAARAKTIFKNPPGFAGAGKVHDISELGVRCQSSEVK